MLVFTQTVRTGDTEARTLVEEDTTEEKALDRMVPLIIILSCLITVLVFVMIIVTLVKKSSEYGKNSGLQTRNPNLIQRKYNTLTARQIAIIESVYNNQEQTPLIPTQRSILVKKVTFEKPASSTSESKGSEKNSGKY